MKKKTISAYPFFLMTAGFALAGIREGTAVNVRFLSDGLFISGIFIVSAFALTFCAQKGAFDMLFFGIKQVFAVFSRKDRPKQTYYDYKTGRKKTRQNMGILVMGVAFLTVAAGLCLLE